MVKNAKYLDENEKLALHELKKSVLAQYPGSVFILFGSKARGDFRVGSDIDILILSSGALGWRDIDNIISIVYEINLLHQTLFTVHTAEKKDWDNSAWNTLPLKESVENDGITV